MLRPAVSSAHQISAPLFGDNRQVRLAHKGEIRSTTPSFHRKPNNWRYFLQKFLMSKNRIKQCLLPSYVLLVTAVVIPLTSCATRVQTPGGEVICYSQNCVEEMQAWTRDEYLSRQYEQTYRNQIESRSQPPKTKVSVPPKYRRPPPITCPNGMVPVSPPEYGCVYPRG